MEIGRTPLSALARFHADLVLALAYFRRIIFRAGLLLIAALLAAVRWLSACCTGYAAKAKQYE
jgi:Ni,Fe-hydrogenase I cytochrome b subunit